MTEMYTHEHISACCKQILSDPSIDAGYRDAVLAGKASDFSVKRVGEILELRAKWNAFVNAESANATESKLNLLERMDMAITEVLDMRQEHYTTDERF